ncbi:MAG: hypothetical protein ACNYVW_09895, partial [Methanosarcinales archaeon]
GGRIVAVACQSVKVSLGGFVCPHTPGDGAAIGLWTPSCFYGYGRVIGGKLREIYIQNQENVKHRRRQTKCENAGVQALYLSVRYGGFAAGFECILPSIERLTPCTGAKRSVVFLSLEALC